MPNYKAAKKEDVLSAIKGSYGIVLTIAGRLGCESRTAKKLIDRWEETRQAYEDENNHILDICESKVYKSVIEGDLNNAKWVLSRKGKDRGWGDDAILKLNNDEPLNITFDGLQREDIAGADNVEIGGLDEATP